jgi:hypothetical protein
MHQENHSDVKYFLDKKQNTVGNIILRAREEQDGDPSRGMPHQRGEVLHPSRGIHKISSCGIAFHGRGITFCRRGIEDQIGVMNCSQSNGPI